MGYVCRGHQAIREREEHIFLMRETSLEEVGRMAEQLYHLDHLVEAERNLRDARIDMEGSGVRIMDLLFLVLVFRRAQRRRANAGSVGREDRGGGGGKRRIGGSTSSRDRGRKRRIGGAGHSQ